MEIRNEATGSLLLKPQSEEPWCALQVLGGHPESGRWGSRATLPCSAPEGGVFPGRSEGCPGRSVSSHLTRVLGELCVRPGLVGDAGPSPGLCEPQAHLPEGTDALCQLPGRSDEMSVASGASCLG